MIPEERNDDSRLERRNGSFHSRGKTARCASKTRERKNPVRLEGTGERPNPAALTQSIFTLLPLLPPSHHGSPPYSISSACSVGWWLMAGAGLFWEKSTAGWLRLVAGGWFILREKYCWLHPSPTSCLSTLTDVRRPSSHPCRTARRPLGCFPHNAELYPYPAALHWAIGYGALLAFACSKRADGRDHERRRTNDRVNARERKVNAEETRWAESMKCN
jgi:FAD/FMN-containing dehydrogenase